MVTGAAAAVLIVAAVVIGRPTQDNVDTETPATPAGDAPAADANNTIPRYLVTQEGWGVDNFGEDDTGGTTDFSDDAENLLELTHGANYEAQYEALVEDRTQEGQDRSTTTIAGREAVLFEADDDGPSFEAFWLHDDYVFALRGDTFATREEFEAVAATVREVDEEAWSAALPEDLIHPGRVSCGDRGHPG